MNKKSLITMLVALVLVAAVGVGATLAFLTDSTDEVKNTFKVGNVDITLTETAGAGETNATVEENETNGYEFSNLQPGDVVNKKPVVTVEDGSNDCYVFVKVVGADGLTTDISSEKWTEVGDGIYKYNNVCRAGDELTVFETVTVSTEATEDTEFDNIVVKACAVQSANITESDALSEAQGLLNQ